MPGDPPKILLTTACDDVRIEAGNKYSLIGIYGNILTVTSIPAFIPKLFFVQAWLGGHGTFRVRYDFMSPSKKQVGRVDLQEFSVPPLNISGPYAVFAGMIAIILNEAGDYQLVTYLDDKVTSTERVQVMIVPQI